MVCVRLPSVSVVAVVRPFKGWGATGSPTQELAWYNSYNSTKHDREANLGDATLGMLFEAVAAAAIMLVAQFGLLGSLGQRTEVRDFFHFLQFPAWDVSDVYAHPFGLRAQWEPVNYPFR